MSDIDLSQLAPVLDQATAVYVAVRSTSGPHLTPELFTVSGGQILCLTSADSLKARIGRHGGRIAVGAASGSAALVVAGAMAIADPTSLRSLIEGPAAAMRAPLGVTRFVRDNAAEMLGAAGDALAGRLGRPFPTHRVVLAISPEAAFLVESGQVRLAEGWDAYEGLEETQDTDAEESASVDFSELPDQLRQLAVSGPAVVGWLRSDGAPLAFPGHWDADVLEATIPLVMFDTCGGALAGPACVTLDQWTGYGPGGKQGVMLRGEATASRDGDAARLRLRIDRASHWDGIDTGTVTFGRTRADPG